MTYTVRLTGSVPDGGGVLPVWPLGIPPTPFATALKAFDAGNCELLSLAMKGNAATFLVLNRWGRAVDPDGWSLGL